MIRWFLIGCAIVGGINGGMILWEALPDRVQEFLEMVFTFAAVSAICGFIAWLIFRGVA